MSTQNFKVYAYLRASTKEQDATRSLEELKNFAKEKKFEIDDYYFENESGTVLERPKLYEIINQVNPVYTNIILIEEVDRLTRLNEKKWSELSRVLDSKNIHIVALELPTSHMILSQNESADEFLGWMLKAVNKLVLECAAALARKLYEVRKKRCEQGIKKAIEKGVKLGRKVGSIIPRIQKIEPDIVDFYKKHPIFGSKDASRMFRTTKETIGKILKRNGFKYLGKELGWQKRLT